jgi:hypothetical protein
VAWTVLGAQTAWQPQARLLLLLLVVAVWMAWMATGRLLLLPLLLLR